MAKPTFEQAMAWHAGGENVAPQALSVLMTQAIIDHYREEMRSAFLTGWMHGRHGVKVQEKELRLVPEEARKLWTELYG